METHQTAVESWAVYVVLIGLPICFFLFFKSFRAQTRMAYWTYNGLVAAVMLVIFGLLTKSGLMPSPETLREKQVEAPPPGEIFSNLPTSTVVLIVVVAIIWIGGGNWIVIRQRRRAGRSWWESLNPFNPPFRDMTASAWGQLALLAVLTLVILFIGVGLIGA